MKIRFLGTSHGVPMPGRFCQSIMIETKGGSYLFDAGAPVMDILIREKYELERIRAIFVTHLHMDHLAGLPAMFDLTTWYFKDMKYTVYLPEQRGIDAFTDFGASILYEKLTDRIQFRLVEEGTFYEDENLKVTAVHTEHLAVTTNAAYGYLIEAEGKKVYITGDMNQSLEDFPVKLLSEPTDLLISECAHFPAELLIEKLKRIHVQKAAVVHVFPVEKYEVLKQYAKKADFEMIFPSDGDTITM